MKYTAMTEWKGGHPAIYLELVLRREQDAMKPPKAYVLRVEDDDRNDYQLSIWWGPWEKYKQDPDGLTGLRTNRRRPRHRGQDLWELKRVAYVLQDRKEQREHFRLQSVRELVL